MIDEKLPTGDARTAEFLRLLGGHEERTAAYIYALVPDWDHAQDIAQEVRLRLWEQFDQYDRTKDFGAWARTIAWYMVLAHREKESRRGDRLFGQVFLEAVEAEAADAAEQSEERGRALHACLRKLAEASRDLLLRWYAAGQSARQVADESGRSYEGTRKAIYRLRLDMAECIRNRLAEGRS